MKILAYSLFVLGPVMIVFSRPFTDNTNFILLSAGAVVGMVGFFVRNRVKAGTPIFSATNPGMHRRLYPQEIVILVLTLVVLLTFGLTGLWFPFVFGLLSAGVGVICIARPQWLVYGNKTPERLAEDRIGRRVRGFMLLTGGILLLLVSLLSHWSRHGR
jgi:hypothetical protein